MKKNLKRKRSRVENASLIKSYNSMVRQEYIDLDYINKLNSKDKTCKLPNGSFVTELEYMSIFMAEWNNGEVSKQSEAKKNKFHRTAKEVKDCTDRNNSRNRDSYGITQAKRLLTHSDPAYMNDLIDDNRNINTDNVEDSIIEFLDEAKKTSNSSQDTNDK